MALRAIMLKAKIEKKRAELESLKEKDADFVKREEELEAAIEEAQTEEEQQVVSEKVDEFDKEKNEHEDQKKDLEKEIDELESDLKKEEEMKPEDQGERTRGQKGEKRGMMNRRKFFGMDMQERDAFFANEEVKAFLERTREIAAEKRSVKGADLTIPTVVLDLIRENIMDYSKLVRRVRLVSVSGKARQTVMGTVPEAVWTEMCAKLNEIDFGFTQTEVDGYKVGGVIYICKATLEDSDYDIATEIITALGIAIGTALDKAILYGTGTKMPLGIVTRLEQTSEPSDYPANARPWVNLSASNVVTISGEKTGLEFFKEIVSAGGKTKNRYARNGRFWAMNESTYTKVKIEAMNFNAAGAIVSVQDGTMPVAGGDIVVLSDDIISDNNIVCGYGELYLLAEREGSEFARSDEYKFAEDQVAFKGTARYDGEPVIAEGFVSIGIGSAPAKSTTFAGDTANDASLIGLTIGSETLSPVFAQNKYDYKITSATAGEVEVTATPAQSTAKVKITYDGKNVVNGGKVKLSGTKIMEVEVRNGLGVLQYTVQITKGG